MTQSTESDSRRLLQSLRDALAQDDAGQERLDNVVSLIAQSMQTEVCSLYLLRDADTLELCATQGLDPDAVHKSRLRLGEGLVGRVAKKRQVINAADAPSTKGFRYMPETKEERFSSFLGVPIQRLGQTLGTLVVQSKDARSFSEDEIYALEVVAMVLAEMAELGAFLSDDGAWASQRNSSILLTGQVGQEGASAGQVFLHEPRVVVTNPVADDPDVETERLDAALEAMRISVDRMLAQTDPASEEQTEVLEAFRLFANSKGWRRRMQADIARGMSAEAAVEKEQSVARARMQQAKDPYLRERLQDLDDLSNRLLRNLTGQGKDTGAKVPDRPILVARNIGPGELLEYGRGLMGIVLEEGSVGSHAAIVARALAIPLLVQVKGVTDQALNGDDILVDGDSGQVHLRPDDAVATAFRDKMAMVRQAATKYAALTDQPAVSNCGQQITLLMNAGLMADLPSLDSSGAEGVGLFRTELQFLTTDKMPKRSQLSAQYERVLQAAHGKRVVFRTLDIGSDKVLPYMRPSDEPNPAMGWRAIRVGLDKPGVLRMQLQALLRAADGADLSVMFPFVAQYDEFVQARRELDKAIGRERRLGHRLPKSIDVGAMLETPSLAYATDTFFKEVDFLSIGGNDLKQFFFAADRENERVRRRYDTLNVSFLTFLEHIVQRCVVSGTRLSFCGEDAGRPVEAMCFAALGIHTLSMRPASIGPVKHLIRQTNLAELKTVIDGARATGMQSVRPAVTAWMKDQSIGFS
ncbi:MAG: phosphoenolpyruvate--protein phosphotransferase [Pseudomonadota bacterium]